MLPVEQRLAGPCGDEDELPLHGHNMYSYVQRPYQLSRPTSESAQNSAIDHKPAKKVALEFETRYGHSVTQKRVLAQ